MAKYNDIINKHRPIHKNDYFSFKYPPMNRKQRAKLFMAFDALSGFSEEINKVKKETNFFGHK